MRFKTLVSWLLAPFALGAAMILTSGVAEAQTVGVLTAGVNLRAGPGTEYPIVADMPVGASVAISGCVSGYTWCEVGWGSLHGWVAANYVQVPYQGQTVVIAPNFAPIVGLAVIGFSRAYWDQYYAGRPWFGRWDRYEGRRHNNVHIDGDVNIHRNGDRNVNRNVERNIDRNVDRNVNRNADRNVNRNVNRNVDRGDGDRPRRERRLD